MARPFCCRSPGREDRRNGRISLRLQCIDGPSGPQIRRVEDLRVEVEIRHIDAIGNRRPHHRIERPRRQRVIALMRHEATPEHVDGTWRRGKQLLAERRQHRRDQFEPSGQRGLIDIEHLERGTHEIFVRSRSLRRPTWPRYSLLDHKAFDRALAEQYGADCRIEDCWRPFAAVATNLSTHNLELIRTGLIWQAVRASSAIPGLLPPFYTPEGAMLVDGCLIDNVPLAPMHQLKSGPNLVVHFGEPAAEMFDVDYAALPGRFELIAAMLTPFRKKLLPAAPSAVNVLWRSLVAHQRYDTLPAAPLDHVMRTPIPPGVGVTEFERHTEIFDASYLWAQERIAALEADGNSAIAAILAGYTAAGPQAATT